MSFLHAFIESLLVVVYVCFAHCMHSKRAKCPRRFTGIWVAVVLVYSCLRNSRFFLSHHQPAYWCVARFLLVWNLIIAWSVTFPTLTSSDGHQRLVATTVVGWLVQCNSCWPPKRDAHTPVCLCLLSPSQSWNMQMTSWVGQGGGQLLHSCINPQIRLLSWCEIHSGSKSIDARWGILDLGELVHKYSTANWIESEDSH